MENIHIDLSTSCITKKIWEKKMLNIKYCIKISTYKMMPTCGLHSALRKKIYHYTNTTSTASFGNENHQYNG